MGTFCGKLNALTFSINPNCNNKNNLLTLKVQVIVNYIIVNNTDINGAILLYSYEIERSIMLRIIISYALFILIVGCGDAIIKDSRAGIEFNEPSKESILDGY